MLVQRFEQQVRQGRRYTNVHYVCKSLCADTPAALAYQMQVRHEHLREEKRLALPLQPQKPQAVRFVLSLSLALSVCLSLWLCLCVCVSVCLYLCLSVCLSE